MMSLSPGVQLYMTEKCNKWTLENTTFSVGVKLLFKMAFYYTVNILLIIQCIFGLEMHLFNHVFMSVYCLYFWFILSSIHSFIVNVKQN